MLWVEKDECGGYDTCIEECPEEAIAQEKRKAIIIRGLYCDCEAFLESWSDSVITLNDVTHVDENKFIECESCVNEYPYENMIRYQRVIPISCTIEIKYRRCQNGRI